MTTQERAAASIGGHYDCEDPWYSCPLSPDGCINVNMGKECTCGYDDRKQNVELLITETRRAALLEAAEKVPTTWLDPLLWNIKLSSCPEIEALLRGVKDKITRLAQEG